MGFGDADVMSCRYSFPSDSNILTSISMPILSLTILGMSSISRLAFFTPTTCLSSLTQVIPGEEFARVWWSIYQSHIVKTLIDREEVAAAFVEGIDFALDAFATIIYHLHQLARCGIKDRVCLHRVGGLRDSLLKEICHIYCLDVEKDKKTFVWQLFFK